MFGRKATTAERIAIDIRSWKRAGLLAQGLSFESRWRLGDGKSITLRITNRESFYFDHKTLNSDGCPTSRSYAVHRATTACHLGGARSWFACPAFGYDRRSAILYAHPNVPFFVCRLCAQLGYPCQREDALGRRVRRIIAIRQRLGWAGGPLDPQGGRPRRMRAATFENLVSEHERHVAALLATVQRRWRSAA